MLRGLVWVAFFPSFSGENAQTTVIIPMIYSLFPSLVELYHDTVSLEKKSYVETWVMT